MTQFQFLKGYEKQSLHKDMKARPNLQIYLRILFIPGPMLHALRKASEPKGTDVCVIGAPLGGWDFPNLWYSDNSIIIPT